ncbi:UDP-N-acetylmuramoyl-L-alanine--D-glutamate ligase [Alteromonas sp. ASW11-19]|uniref:UDP-N-acetylmuramoylalanine--D-glutamate ligase n=1 Tax=Alteromonas salexigens TaxID=2982530 RepID=A0ABT2VQD4_9ALTE|nr:UDP-N-acetylmuramoyl-L-alanine--D-glutamate ligase [Alteromonas salexigens]MCU7555528.1 UDP-N-acetylmuramoyl-L-alanine--D-glutamate ligase [Alteromonas salexigens]
MNILENAQHVVVAGLGMTGQACVRFLTGQPVTVTAWDTRSHLNVPDTITVPVILGEPAEDFWQNVDCLILSPGINPQLPAVEAAQAHGVEVMGDVELFARLNTVPAFGITGSNGKTTVTLLLTHILQAAGKRAIAAGNVGTPVLDTLDQSLDAVVLELSSFQLETTSSLTLQAATILNISDDHLDRHGTLQRYLDAKQRIFAHCDTAVVWRGQAETRPTTAVNNMLLYGLDDVASGLGYRQGWITLDNEPVVDMQQVALVGRHNVLNIQAALAMAMTAGVPPHVAAEAVYEFSSAPHRCVEIASHNDVRWIDDSKATNVGATLAAIEGIGPGCSGNLILIAGGDAKGADLSALAAVISENVHFVIALGRDGERIAALSPCSAYVQSLQEAVALAYEKATPGDVVLLSPACASLDMFDNYIHRASVFADAVKGVTADA